MSWDLTNVPLLDLYLHMLYIHYFIFYSGGTKVDLFEASKQGWFIELLQGYVEKFV